MEQPGKINENASHSADRATSVQFFLPENTKLLMLGSFPPPRARWSMNFYYPEYPKRHVADTPDWFFYNDKEYFLETKKLSVKRKKPSAGKGIGIGDTAMEIIV